MAYFPDLSVYAYGRGNHPGVVHVGWLDGMHPFSKGAVEPSLIEKMKLLASEPVELYRGVHICELCSGAPDFVIDLSPKGRIINPEWDKWAEHRSGNGEFRVAGEGIVFAAPVLIVHYIEEHGYLPAAQFLEAIAKTAVCTCPRS